MVYEPRSLSGIYYLPQNAVTGRRPKEVSCRDWCHYDGLRKFILLCGGLLCGNSSCDVVFVLQSAAADEAGKCYHLAEVCALLRLKSRSYPRRMVTHFWKRLTAYFGLPFLIRRWAAVARVP